jgi:hypothetical protein
MGGYGAANLALRHPDVFAQTVPIAGYFHIDDPSGVFGGDPVLQAANSPDAHVAVAHNLRLLLLDGDRDDEPVVEGEAARFKALLDLDRVPAELKLAPGGHTWGYVASQYPTVFGFLERLWGTLVHGPRGIERLGRDLHLPHLPHLPQLPGHHRRRRSPTPGPAPGRAPENHPTRRR